MDRKLWIRIRDTAGTDIETRLRTGHKDLSFGTRMPGGFWECSMLFPCDRVTAFDWYDNQFGYRLTIYEADEVVWDGRVEDMEIVDEGVRITARGYWANCSDVPFNATYAGTESAGDVIKAALTASCSQIAADQTNIDNGVVVAPIEYLDNKYPATIFEELGEAGSAGTPWYAYVYEDKTFCFRARGTSVNWEIGMRNLSAGAVSLTRSLKEVWNSVAAEYTDGTTKLVTGTAADAASTAKYGLMRRRVLSGGAAPAVYGTAIRDVFLTEHKNTPQRSSLKIDGCVYGAGAGSQGEMSPLWRLRAGDRLRITDLVPSATTASDAPDGLRIFHVLETTYEYENNTLSLTPDYLAQTAERLIAEASLPQAQQVSQLAPYFTRTA